MPNDNLYSERLRQDLAMLKQALELVDTMKSKPQLKEVAERILRLRGLLFHWLEKLEPDLHAIAVLKLKMHAGLPIRKPHAKLHPLPDDLEATLAKLRIERDQLDAILRVAEAARVHAQPKRAKKPRGSNPKKQARE